MASPRSWAGDGGGEDPCPEILATQASQPSQFDSSEKAIAEAWVQLLELGLLENGEDQSRVLNALMPLKESPQSMPEGVFGIASVIGVSSELAEGFEQLARMAEALLTSRMIMKEALTDAFATRIDSLLVSMGVTSSVAESVVESRNEIQSVVTVVPMRGGACFAPVRWSDGSWMATGNSGKLVKFDSRGREIFSVGTGHRAAVPPLELSNRKALFVSQVGRAWVVDATGNIEYRLDVPIAYGSMRPLRLQDGGILFQGSGGEVMVLNADGSVRGEVNLAFWNTGNPIEQSDGTLVLLAPFAGVVHRISPQASLLGTLRLRELTTFQGAPLQLEDGSWVALDSKGHLRFFDPDWNARRKWWYFSKVTLRPRGGGTGRIIPFSRGWYGVRGWKNQFLFFNKDGEVLRTIDDLGYLDAAPLELRPGVFLYASMKRGWVIDGPSAGETHALDLDAQESLAHPPALMADGTIAFIYRNGKLRVLDSSGAQVFSYAFSSEIADVPALMEDGRHLVPLVGAGVAILDPRLIDSAEGSGR